MKENIDSTFLPGATTVVDSIELLNEFEELALDKDLIAFDAEGVDLSRVGELTLLSFGISLFNGVHVFLLDPLCREIGDKTLEVSKRILESKNITKIIHDCRQDSDALYHTFTPSIKLTNVFDTQIWDMNCNHGLRRGLNDVLASHGLQVNQSRNGCVAMYLSNPNFWKQRPLNEKMINYASNDVFQLFNLRSRLISNAGSSTIYERESMKAPDTLRSLNHHVVVSVSQSMKGRVIGSGGTKIREIEKDTNSFVYGKIDGFLVISGSKQNMTLCVMKIKAAASHTFTPRLYDSSDEYDDSYDEYDDSYYEYDDSD